MSSSSEKRFWRHCVRKRRICKRSRKGGKLGKQNYFKSVCYQTGRMWYLLHPWGEQGFTWTPLIFGIPNISDCHIFGCNETMNMPMNGQSSPLDAFREQVSVLRKWVFCVQCQPCRVYTFYIEKTINYPMYRWLVLVLTLILYARRIFHVQGFYLITYTLALYLLNLLLGFLSPLVLFCLAGLMD